MSPDLDNAVLLRVSYFRRPDGSVYEVRRLGDRIVWQGEVNLVLWELDQVGRSVFTPDIIREQRVQQGILNATLDMLKMRWPWEKRCTALMIEGPKAMVLYRGGRVQ